LLVSLRRSEFAFVEVCDISVRFYKTEPSRFRPTDRMIAHTGYLVFARPVLINNEERDLKLLQEIGLMSKLDNEIEAREDLE